MLPGSTDLSERVTSTTLGLSERFQGTSVWRPEARSKVMESMQAVPVEERVRWLSRPAMRTASVESFQPVPGMSWRGRVGPVKGSNPQNSGR